MKKPDDERLAAAILIKIANREPERALGPDAAEDALEIAETVDRDGRFLVAVDRAALGPPDEGGDGGRDTGDGAHAAGDFFNINAGISG